MHAEFAAVIRWYLFCVALGWGTFPLVYTCFRHFPERGLAFAKTQGLFLLAYLIWIATSCGLTRYAQSAIGWMLLAYLIGNAFLLAFQFRSILVFIKTRFKLILLMEGIFLLFFAGFTLIRMYNPELTGAEKEADFTFLNAILHSKTFPPKDTWFAGASINYYYFGYLIWATVIKLTGIIAPIGFNLALATIVALSATGSFGLVYYFTRRNSYSFLAACGLCVFGNLDGLVQVLERGGQVFPFDWWRSSRVIPDTINEFPYFSFLLGDLHAHFMAIPFAILLLGLASQFADRWKPDRFSKTCQVWDGIYQGMLLFFISLALGGASVINSWDYPTYFIIAAICIGIAGLNGLTDEQDATRKIRRILKTLLLAGAVLILSRGLFWPFYRYYTPQVRAANLRFVAAAQRTGVGDFLVIYGFFLWVLVFFGYGWGRRLFSLFSAHTKDAKLVYGNGLVLFAVLVYLLFATWVLPISGLIMVILLYLSYQEFLHPKPQTPIPYLWVFMAFAIIAGCELVYIKDFYGHPLERQNTIFKFYYQAWILLSLGVPALLARVSANKDETPPKFRLFWQMGFIALCGACCIYPLFATMAKANYFRSGAHGGVPYVPTLNGISYIADRDPDEYEALLWIQAHLDEDAVILEATGKPYSFFGRVATTTGRSTVLGWGNHESLWRDQTWQTITQRTAEIKQMYDAVEKPSIMGLVQKYTIQYVYVGRLERETYLGEGLRAFEQYFPQVFKNRSVAIYQTF